LIAVKDWAKPPSDHVDPYHLGIRFVGFLTAIFLPRFIYIFAVVDLDEIRSAIPSLGFGSSPVYVFDS
jgi:hypothetical protein